jgi:hypothetical protein
MVKYIELRVIVCQPQVVRQIVSELDLDASNVFETPGIKSGGN